MKLLILIILSIVTTQLFAKEINSTPSFDQKVESIVQSYSVNKFLLGDTKLNNKHHCDEDTNSNQSCMSYVCDQLGTFGCDSRTELEQVASMCRGVRGDGCISYICDQLGSFGCDSKGELEKVASMCKRRVGGKCMRFICNKLGSFGCDSSSELEQVSTVCRDVRGDNCLSFTCERLGSFGCDSFSELSQVATTCAGRN